MITLNTIKRSCLAMLFFLLSTAVTRADTLFDQTIELKHHQPLKAIAERLGQVSVLRCQFEQTKTLKILRRPMLSRGTLLYAQQHGLYWHTEQPFPATLVITETALLQKDGHKTRTITAHSQPVLFGFSQVFFRLLSGDVGALSEHFTLHFQAGEQQWRIGLLPKQAALQQFIERVILRGDDVLKSVTIMGKAGDITDIQFSSISAAPAQLTAVERGYFKL